MYVSYHFELYCIQRELDQLQIASILFGLLNWSRFHYTHAMCTNPAVENSLPFVHNVYVSWASATLIDKTTMIVPLASHL